MTHEWSENTKIGRYKFKKCKDKESGDENSTMDTI